LKILHVTEYCHAGSVGGTERYILDLNRSLGALGHDGVIVWLGGGAQRETFESKGIRIIPLPAPPMRVDAPLSGFAGKARRMLEVEKPDLLHFHTFGLTEALLAKLGKERGIPYVFTYHSPAWTCRRETMLLWGKELCDGEVRTMRCSACKSHERIGISPVLGWLAAIGSAAVGWMLPAVGATKFRRRIAFVRDTSRFRRELREFLRNCNRVFALNSLAQDILVRNGAKCNLVALCPPGAPIDMVKSAPLEASKARDAFVIGYIGRVAWVKGVHILIQAFRMTNLQDAQVWIYGWNNADPAYAKTLKQLIGDDHRIKTFSTLPMEEMAAEYDKLSLVAMPSIWLEMAPLVLQEAWCRGTPVYGSARIGQAEELRVRGCLVDPNTPEAWKEALEKAFANHCSQLKDEIPHRLESTRNIRTMADVAREMLLQCRNVHES
jgi:glycosyltransferase involved in cell wall biosynthesis